MKTYQQTISSVIGLVLVVIVALVLWPMVEQDPKVEQGPVTSGVFILPLTLKLADDPTEQEMGLSGRKSMPMDEGMLFSFQVETIPGFWMKDMNFALDFVWLNKRKEIIQIDENVSPDTYPEILSAQAPVKYVVEVNAGVVKTLGLHLGQRVDFGLVLE